MIDMERKIGEIFEYNGEWYQCVEQCVEQCVGHEGCHNCAFELSYGIRCNFDGVPHCSACRSDGKPVIFKKLEKVGEPYEFDGHLFQSYRTFEVPIFTENYATVRELGNNSKISIEIKQNKEDMEEKKLNLKPFDIQKAREGKPVCTRDGRKARIICFDRKGYNMFPIVALIMNGDRESDIYTYRPNGTWDNSGNESDKDLMMLPEKKEGWVNVYKDSVYDTKDEALIGRSEIRDYIDTIKISWEE